MTQIEQFWYTRPASGAARVPGFQIVAASPGLQDRRGHMVTVGLRLCRYDHPAGAAGSVPPVSFGWVDAGELRFCFHRVPLGADEYGRPGNFAAHILIGSRDLLPAAAIAASFGSPWWWRGEMPVTEELPSLVDLAEIPPGHLPETGDFLAPFLDALLRRGPRILVSVRADPPLVASLVVAVEQCLGGLMDQHSVSTYESPETASWFDVVGVVQPPLDSLVVTAAPDPGTPAVVARARSLVISGDAGPRLLAMAAQAAGLGSSAPEVASLAGFICAYGDLAGGNVPPEALLTGLLSRPAVVNLTLSEFPAVCAEMARALVQRGAAAAGPISAAVQAGAGQQALGKLGAAIAQVLIEEPAAPVQWDAGFAQISKLDAALATACFHTVIELASDTPQILDATSVKVRLTLLRQAARDGLGPAHPVVGRLLSTLGEDWPAVVTDGRGFSAEWRGWALASAVTESGRASPADAAAQLLRSPDIIESFTARIPGPGHLRPVVRAVAPERQASFVLDTCPALPLTMRAELLEWFVSDVLPAGAHMRFLLTCRQRRVLPRAEGRLAAAGRSAVCLELRRSLDARRIPSPALTVEDLLRWCAGAESGAWLSVLAMARSVKPSSKELKSAVVQAGTLATPSHRDIAFYCAVVFFVAHRPAPLQFEQAIDSINPQQQEGILVLAVACAHVLRAANDETPARAFLRCLIRMVADSRLRTGSEAGRNPEPQIKSLVGRLSDDCREGLEREARQSGSAAQDWWHRVSGGGVVKRAMGWLGEIFPFGEGSGS